MPIGTPGTTPNSTLDAGAFSKCAPSLRTNIRQCGTVTAMNAAPMTLDDLSVYQKSGDWRVMEALFHHDMEIKMCEAVQNGLYDFLMSQKVNLSKRISTRRLNSGLLEIAPFIMARQYSPINNEFWKITGGTASAAHTGATGTLMSGVVSDWKITVASNTNIPADANYFPVGQRVFAQGKTAGGSATRTQWAVVAVVDTNAPTSVDLYLHNENSASNLLPYMGDKLGAPVTGLLQIGTPNVNEYEKFCSEGPTVLNWKNVPFWVEGTRDTMCKSSLYDNWRSLLLSGNAEYKEFFDLDEIEKNKQLGASFQHRQVTQWFWGKPAENQTMATYDDLPQIAAFDASTLGLTGHAGIMGMGVDGGAVIGRRANAIGIYEQLAACDRVADAQGLKLNLPALLVEIYNMMRVREGNGTGNPKAFDLFTDSVTAELINQAMILYYKAKSGSQLMYTVNAEGPAKKAEFGFNYRSYVLFWPAGVTLNVVTHYAFDDWRSAGISAIGAGDNTTRVLWVLDFTGIYPGIISSARTVHETGNLKTMAAVNADFACVQKVPTRELTMTGITSTMIVECPMGNLIIENFSGDVPEFATMSGAYPATNTTSTSGTPFNNED